jgi:hypothetical protein
MASEEFRTEVAAQLIPSNVWTNPFQVVIFLAKDHQLYLRVHAYREPRRKTFRE